MTKFRSIIEALASGDRLGLFEIIKDQLDKAKQLSERSTNNKAVYIAVCTDLHGGAGPFDTADEALQSAIALNQSTINDGGRCMYVAVPLFTSKALVIPPWEKEPTNA